MGRRWTSYIAVDLLPSPSCCSPTPEVKPFKQPRRTVMYATHFGICRHMLPLMVLQPSHEICSTQQTSVFTLLGSRETAALTCHVRVPLTVYLQCQCVHVLVIGRMHFLSITCGYTRSLHCILIVSSSFFAFFDFNRHERVSVPSHC